MVSGLCLLWKSWERSRSLSWVGPREIPKELLGGSAIPRFDFLKLRFALSMICLFSYLHRPVWTVKSDRYHFTPMREETLEEIRPNWSRHLLFVQIECYFYPSQCYSGLVRQQIWVKWLKNWLSVGRCHPLPGCRNLRKEGGLWVKAWKAGRPLGVFGDGTWVR